MLDAESFLLAMAAGGGGGGGGKGYATGTYTLASQAEHLIFNPGLPFTPRAIAIYAKSPNYAINGVAGVVFVKGIPLTILGPSSDVGYVYTSAETRTTWGTNAHWQVNVTINNVDPELSASTVDMPCRNGNYKWPVGEFIWEAWE